jgi:hypothetical protein
VLNSFRDRCLDIAKLFDTFSINHIPREENSKANQLAQQALGYVVTQGVFWVTSIGLVENRFELRSKGKSMLDNVDRLKDKGKPISDKANRLPNKSEPEPGNPDGSQDKAKPTSDKEAKEESVMKKSEFEKVESPLDNEITKPIRVDDSAKDSDTVRADKCIRNLGMIADKKLKWQVLKYMSLDDDLYRRTIDDVLIKCLGDNKLRR